MRGWGAVPVADDWPLTSDLGPLGVLPTVPRLARGFVRVTLDGWRLDALADVTELLVSEMSTNVVRASTDPDGILRYDEDGKLPLLWIRLLCDRVRLMIEVWDTLPASLGAPVARHPDPDEESGRGLEIIEILAEGWGWETVSSWDGKKVWAILKIAQLPARPQADRKPPNGSAVGRWSRRRPWWSCSPSCRRCTSTAPTRPAQR